MQERLIPDEVAATIPALGATEECEAPLAAVHLFTPAGFRRALRRAVSDLCRTSVGPCRTSPEAMPALARSLPTPPRRSARWRSVRLRSSFGAFWSSAGRAAGTGTRQVTGGGTVCLPLPVRTQDEGPAS